MEEESDQQGSNEDDNHQNSCLIDMSDIREFQEECLNYLRRNPNSTSKSVLAAQKGYLIASCIVTADAKKKVD
jgi:hypothetical protein